MSGRRLSPLLGLLIAAAGCSDSGEPGAGAPSGAAGETSSGGDTGSAGETSSGGDTGSAGETSSGGAAGGAASPDPWDPDELEWEALPSLGEGAGESAGQVSVAVSQGGEVYLSAAFAGADWAPPWSLRVFRLVDGDWEMLGGQPVEEGDSVVTNHGLAVAGNGDVYASYGSGGGKLQRFDGSAWSEVNVDAGASDLTTGLATSDASGRVVVLAHTGGDIVAYRLEDDDWLRLGDALAPGTRAPDFQSALAGGGDEVAVTVGDDLHIYRDGSWDVPGPYHDADPMAAMFPSLAYEPDGSLLVSWRENIPDGTRLFASRWGYAGPGEPLGGEMLFESALDPSYASLAVNAASQVFATWRQSTVFVAEHTGGEWQPFIGDGDVAAHTSGGTLPDIALSPEGLPIVAWEAFHEGDSIVGAARAVVTR